MPAGRKPYQFTKDQTDDIVRRYLNRERVSDIARAYGMTFRPIVRVLQEQGVWNPGKGLLPKAGEQAESWYAEGRTVAAIAADLDIPRQTVQRELERRGVYKGGRQYAVQFSTSQKQKIAEQYAAGISARKIAEDWGCSTSLVTKIVKRHGGDVRWKRWEGRHKAAGGYWRVSLPPDDPMRVMGKGKQSYVLEHRLVMARSLGRPLTDDETVHHINGDKTDNRLENLQLRNGNHGKGARFVCLDCSSHNVEAVSL